MGEAMNKPLGTKDCRNQPVHIGDTVRTVTCRGHITAKEAGRNLTVRGTGTRPGRDVRADDGDPANPDLVTNGHTWSVWLPCSAVERVGPSKGPAK